MQTVNVIEAIYGGEIQSLHAFPDDIEGNAKAEELFKRLALEHGANIKRMERYVEDGCWDNNHYSLHLVHSTELVECHEKA